MVLMLILAYIAGFLISWFLMAGMFFAEDQGVATATIAAEFRRRDLGSAIALGLIYAFWWPLTLPLAWLSTGFAEYGVWIVRVPAAKQE